MAILTVPLIPFITRHAYWDHHWFQWTPQHPVADAFFLVFYRGAAATTTTSRLHIGSGDYTFRDEEQRTAAYRFQAAYSYDVQTVVIRYADYVYAVAHTPESTTPKYRFHPVSTNAEEMCYVHDLSATQALILTTDESGNLRDYTHRNGAHAFCLKLDPPLLSLPSAKSGRMAAYTMTLDQQPSCIEGIVHMESSLSEVVLHWEPQQPHWTQSYPFQSRLHRDADDTVALTVRRDLRQVME